MNELIVMLQLDFFSKKPYKIKLDQKGIIMMPMDDLSRQGFEIKTSEIQSIRWIANITYELEIETVEKTWVASIDDVGDCYDLYQKMHNYFPDKCV